LKIPSEWKGKNLKDFLIASHPARPDESMKLICSGKSIEDEDTVTFKSENPTIYII
jgi:hypothetical protein